MKRLRVIFTIARLTPEAGGPSRSVPALANALAGLGMEVHVLTLDLGRRNGAPLLPTDDRVQTHLVKCPITDRIPGLWALQFLVRLRNLASYGTRTVIHDQGVWLPTNWIAGYIARRGSAALINSPRGMLSGWAMDFHARRKRVAWRLYQHRTLLAASLLHATAQSEAEEIRALGFLHPIAVIPNGIELPLNAPPPLHSSGRRTLLFLSRLHPKKGIQHLVDAWVELRPQGWRVVVAGPSEGGHQEKLQERVRALQLSADFDFVGPVYGEAKWELYHQADLFVLPSYSENFGIVIAEALACGVPVITTRATPWHLLEAHKCGWWIDTGTEALAKALQHAMSIPAPELEAMGKRGADHVRRNFAWPDVARKMAGVYGWVLNPQESQPECVVVGRQ